MLVKLNSWVLAMKMIHDRNTLNKYNKNKADFIGKAEKWEVSSCYVLVQSSYYYLMGLS